MIYTYEGCCSARIRERTCRLAEYEADPSFQCPECGAQLRRVLTAPRVLMNTKPFEAFKSPVDGSIITGEASLREHNKRNNVVQLHEGYDEKGVQNLTKRDYQKEQDAETQKDLREDMKAAIQKLDQGYTPIVAHEDSPL